MSGPNPENEGVLLGVARVLGLPDGASLAGLRPSGLWKVTQRELLDIARLLGLTKISRLNKQALLAKVWESLERLGAIAPNGGSESMPVVLPSVPRAAGRKARSARAAMAPAAGSTPSVELKSVVTRVPQEPPELTSETPPAAAHKFDMGQAPDSDPAKVRALAEAHIPWSYGRDRVTAMPVDADRLFVYWEVTDDAVARARAGLGPGGADAWLSLRIYDVTGRLFDGTNAHSYFDNRVDRSDRQWFFQVGKPTSHLVVDIGMKSNEGYFTKIARSGRVEFPRREPVPSSEPEWTTVRVASGEIAGGSHGVSGRRRGRAVLAGLSSGPDQPDRDGMGEDVIAGVRRRMWEGRLAVEGGELVERQTWEEAGTTELYPELSYGWSWEGDREVASWSAGPFSYPVELRSGLVRESYAGTARTFRVNGRTHVVWGPWQIVIRGVGAHAEQEVLARWEVYRSWTSSGWREVEPTAGRGQPVGSSELMAGASERWGRAAASCGSMAPPSVSPSGPARSACWGPASAGSWAPANGCSRGASERRWLGASEWRFAGGQRAAAGVGPANAGWVEPASSWAARASAEAASPTTSSGSAWPSGAPRTSEGEAAAMATGYFSLVLHAHLPFVRHPEDPTVMEERWLQEAIVGHLPAAAADVRGAGLRRRSLPLHGLAVGAAHHDADRRSAQAAGRRAHGFADRARRRRRSSGPNTSRTTSGWPTCTGTASRACATPGAATTAIWCAPSASCRTAGYLEVITSTATHPFFPLMDRNWAAMRAQVQTAAALYEKHFGRSSLGMWLGECGYIPGVDELLREAAVRYFLVDTHAILYADRRPAFGVYAPLYCSTGVAAFGRDSESSEQVWSAKHGYPGDPQYRDFYRDIGFDLPLDYIGPHIHPEGHRMYTGFKYHAITHDKLHDKWVYDPDAARGRAGLHASHFRGNMEKQAERLRGGMDRPPIIVSPYDAELFGHWWYEGPIFLSDLFRQLHFDQSVLEPITPGRLPGPPPHQPAGHPRRLLLGSQGLQRAVAQRDQRLDLPPPARRRPSAWSSWPTSTGATRGRSSCAPSSRPPAS